MEDNNFKKTEYTLYNYKSLDTKIKNIDIDIDNLENDITVNAISYEERSSPTNAFSSTVENEVIKREEKIADKIQALKSKRKYNLNLKTKIDGALEQLTSDEFKLVELRYFSKDKKTWVEIGLNLGFDKDYCTKLRNKIIDKLSDLIYP
ncbi:hypothetical protein [Clostridium beijerinckii]|uniref:DNA-directed RNA polymerase sigma subunit (Sigma70/sigma32) n=1 Tax=Clostridium beijerinckii TaxID=1520 RepID=A0AAE5H7L6_CLOBE|nr:hypothetical protein [Clostridium beijerinckii]NSB15851.1 DNA-directed RNA polymerase sigma subunit (sigma70/sigma32) [Clostridium beijerinckii]OOM27974.1 hypothetical protein CLOBE_28920 [Clostridium beijerinckii]